MVNADDQKVKDADAALEALGVKITHLPTGQISVALDQAKLNAAQIDMNNFLATLSRNVVNIPVQVQPRDNGLPILVFDLGKPENIAKACEGEMVGTLVKE